MRSEVAMSAREFATNVTVIVAVMAIGAAIETVAPFFVAGAGQRDRRTANLGLTVCVFLLNWILSSSAAVLALSLRPAGFMSVFSLPAAAQILIGVVVLDFSIGYLSHRLLHASPLLWR